jgi:hypothetical protein
MEAQAFTVLKDPIFIPWDNSVLLWCEWDHGHLERKEGHVSWRHKYHIRNKKFREVFKNNIYTDEESVIGRHSINTDWREETLKTPRQALLSELCTGLCHLQDDGHILHQHMPKKREGFIANAKLVFLHPFTPQKKKLVLLTMKSMVTAMKSTLLNNFFVTSRLNR